MAQYIDGFVHPIPRDKLGDYQALASIVAEIWKEHGALDYVECLGDDMHLEGTSSFVDLTAASKDEVILFGWVTFESRAARDRVNDKVSSDPRMEELMARDVGFDPARMAYGGFQPFIALNSA